MDHRHLAASAALGALWFAACQVYDPADLTGGGRTGEETGGSIGAGGEDTGGTNTSGATGGSAGDAGSSATGGSGGDAATGGDGGASTGGSETGGSETGGSSSGGSSTGGKATGGSMTGGSAGSGSSGKGGNGGSAAGTAGSSSGGASAGGTENGGAGNGGAPGAGMSGMAGAGGAGAGGSGGGGTVVLLMGTASADSSQSGHPPGDGNDGITSTRWCAANGSTGHYWTIDLGAAHPLARIEVMWEYPNQAMGLVYGYVISISQDGATFTPSIDRSTNADTTQTQSSSFPASTSGRYVRVTVTSLPASTPQPTWASFYEARIYGQ